MSAGGCRHQSPALIHSFSHLQGRRPMFLGRFDHVLDEKGRLAIPARFRVEVQEGMVITRGTDRWLYIFPMPPWQGTAAPTGRVLGLDHGPQALALARARLAPFGERAGLVHANFAARGDVAARSGFRCVGGVLLDLGVSSMQLDTPERGFSFLGDAPLD